MEPVTVCTTLNLLSGGSPFPCCILECLIYSNELEKVILDFNHDEYILTLPFLCVKLPKNKPVRIVSDCPKHRSDFQQTFKLQTCFAKGLSYEEKTAISSFRLTSDHFSSLLNPWLDTAGVCHMQKLLQGGPRGGIMVKFTSEGGLLPGVYSMIGNKPVECFAIGDSLDVFPPFVSYPVSKHGSFNGIFIQYDNFAIPSGGPYISDWMYNMLRYCGYPHDVLKSCTKIANDSEITYMTSTKKCTFILGTVSLLDSFEYMVNHTHTNGSMAYIVWKAGDEEKSKDFIIKFISALTTNNELDSLEGEDDHVMTKRNIYPKWGHRFFPTPAVTTREDVGNVAISLCLKSNPGWAPLSILTLEENKKYVIQAERAEFITPHIQISSCGVSCNNEPILKHMVAFGNRLKLATQCTDYALFRVTDSFGDYIMTICENPEPMTLSAVVLSGTETV